MILATTVLVVARPARGGPDVPAGDYVEFSCPKGAIKLGGTQECSNGNANILVCGSPTCSSSLLGSTDSGYSFGSWETAGDASVLCSTCSSTTLDTSDPGGGHFSGSVSECVQGAVSFTSSVTATATNATVYFTPGLPPGCSTTVDVTLVWGNSTGYPFTAINDLPYNAGTQYSILLDYLQPGVTYYYKLTGTSPCCSQGSSTGSWVTSSDTGYITAYGDEIRGTVLDATGAAAPANVQVQVSCTAYAASGDWSDAVFTSSTGTYQIPVGWNGEPRCNQGYGYYVVQIQNGWGYGGTLWKGHWNETIVVWAPQFVNFYLPLDTLSTKPVVVAMEFTNTNHATVSYCKTTSNTQETEADYSVSATIFGITQTYSSSVGSETSFGSFACIDNQNVPGYEDWGYPYVTGDIMFNAIGGRSTSIPWTQYYGGLNNPTIGNATGAPIQDWMSEPTSSSQACEDANGNIWFHARIPANTAPQTYGISVGGEVSQITNEQFGVTIPLELDGVSAGSFGGNWGYDLTNSQSYTYAVSWTIAEEPSVQYFTVECAGAGAQSQTGEVVSVWQDSGPG